METSYLAKDVKKYALKTKDKGLRATLTYALTRVFYPSKIKATVATAEGATGTFEAEYPEKAPTQAEEQIPFSELFERLDRILKAGGLRVWLLLDRLDEAFPGKPTLEARALRSLLYAFKDTLGLSQIRVKIFIRDDIYQRVTQSEGFAALTHIGDRASSPIIWDEDGLLALIVERILWNDELQAYTAKEPGIDSREGREAVFYTIFELKVDPSENKPTTVDWIMSRIRDGNGVMTPRDLIELVRHARTLQLEIFNRDKVEEDTKVLLYSPMLKEALVRLSKDKVQNTLFAEYPHLRKYIERFKGSKAEHNDESLRKLFDEDPSGIAKELVSIGFLERLPKSYKIPFLYRDGADVTQGKAF